MVLSVASVAALVAIAELVSGFLLVRREPPTHELTRLYAVEPDPDLGYALVAGGSHRAAKVFDDGRTCYDVTYHFDEQRRRTLFQRYDPSHPHVALLGCSVTFGEGLDDEDTLAFQLMARLPDRNVFNYAAHGYGPSHALARLASGELRDGIVARRGLALYVLLPSHTSRVIGDTRASWNYNGPFYTLEGGHRLVRKASFATGRPLRTRLFRSFTWLKERSRFLRWVGLDLPLSLSPEDHRLAARVLIEARDEYEGQFDGTFHVVFHPSWNLADGDQRSQHEAILSELAAARMEVLDYAGEGLGAAQVIDADCDLHPSGAVNAALAAAIERDLFGDAQPASAPAEAGP